MKTKFWMVLGAGTPTVKHLSEAAARSEAERLARYNSGQAFFVLEAIAVAEKTDVFWSELVKSGETTDEVHY